MIKTDPHSAGQNQIYNLVNIFSLFASLFLLLCFAPDRLCTSGLFALPGSLLTSLKEALINRELCAAECNTDVPVLWNAQL